MPQEWFSLIVSSINSFSMKGAKLNRCLVQFIGDSSRMTTQKISLLCGLQVSMDPIVPGLPDHLRQWVGDRHLRVHRLSAQLPVRGARMRKRHFRSLPCHRRRVPWLLPGLGAGGSQLWKALLSEIHLQYLHPWTTNMRCLHSKGKMKFWHIETEDAIQKIQGSQGGKYFIWAFYPLYK